MGIGEAGYFKLQDEIDRLTAENKDLKEIVLAYVNAGIGNSTDHDKQRAAYAMAVDAAKRRSRAKLGGSDNA